MIGARYLQRNPHLLVQPRDARRAGSRSGRAGVPDHEAAQVRAAHRGGRVHLGVCARRSTWEARSGATTRDPSSKAEPVHNLVHRDVLSQSGPTFTGRRGQADREFLAAGDAWFRPVSFYVGPDAALYVVDYYRARIEHPEWTSSDLQRDPTLPVRGPGPRSHLPRGPRSSIGTGACSAGPWRRVERAAGRPADGLERVVATHGAAAARRTRGSQRRACADEARDRGADRTEPAARLVDPRGPRRAERRHHRTCARRCGPWRPRERSAPCRIERVGTGPRRAAGGARLGPGPPRAVPGARDARQSRHARRHGGARAVAVCRARGPLDADCRPERRLRPRGTLLRACDDRRGPDHGP